MLNKDRHHCTVQISTTVLWLIKIILMFNFFLEKPLKDQTLEEMFLNTKWVSTKTRNDRNNSLPIQKFDVPKNTVEENPDMVN